MKRIMKMAALALVLLLGSTIQQKLAAQYDEGYNDSDRDVSYQTFYDELSPHGRWVDYPGHGYVWVPDAGPDFKPYSTNGHWVWSDEYEWTWVSDYDWGWAPFHYGRWDNDPSYGWYWVPGYEWSPAWVAWRDGGEYYGWAPIRPGINISINFNIGGYAPPVDFWCFTPRRYITSPRLYDYCVDRRRNVTIINYTTIITNNYRYGNNYGFRTGPRRYDAERYTGRINPVRFRQTYNPGRTTFRNNEISIYRPNVRREENRSIAPRRFDRYENNGGNRVTTRNDNGGFRRNDNNQPGTNNDRRVFDRQDRTNTPNTNNGNADNRRFERRNEVIREPQQQKNSNTERKRFERTENNGSNNNNDRRVFDRQQQKPQQTPQPQQPERRRFERNDNAVSQRQPQQMERRQEVRQPQQQQPQRQFERRDNGSRQDNGGGNTERSSKRRF